MNNKLTQKFIVCITLKRNRSYHQEYQLSENKVVMFNLCYTTDRGKKRVRAGKGGKRRKSDRIKKEGKGKKK